MNFIARTKDQADHTYGIWNNDMQAWQFVYDWNGTETLDVDEAISVAEELNNKPAEAKSGKTTTP